jgi:hypothetical protein
MLLLLLLFDAVHYLTSQHDKCVGKNKQNWDWFVRLKATCNIVAYKPPNPIFKEVIIEETIALSAPTQKPANQTNADQPKLDGMRREGEREFFLLHLGGGFIFVTCFALRNLTC